MLNPTLRKIGDAYHYVTDGKLCDGAGKVSDGLFALSQATLSEYLNRGQGTKFSQFHRIVVPELCKARHIFQGLRRGLFNDDDPNADKGNLIYTWKPRFDVEWTKLAPGAGTTVDRPPPAGAVFVVIACPNVKHREKYGEIDCYIAAWNWIKEDSVLAEAPTEWVDRYDRKLWTRDDK